MTEREELYFRVLENAEALASAFPGASFALTNGSPLLVAKNDRDDPTVIFFRATTESGSGQQTYFYVAKRSSDAESNGNAVGAADLMVSEVEPAASPMITVSGTAILKRGQELYASGNTGAVLRVVVLAPAQVQDLFSLKSRK